MKNKEIKLYHGTTNEHLKNIFKYGLKEPYLSSSLELAEYYANETVYICGGEPIVLKVLVTSDVLSVDFISMEEPVGFENWTINDLENKVEEVYDRLSKEHPEWCEGGYITIPSANYKVSLETVGSCKCNTTIPPQNIEST